MFLNFPILKEDPFRFTPDPAFLYLSEEHAKVQAYLRSSPFLADGFVVITGEAGAGKTILIRDFLDGILSDITTVEIHQTQYSPLEFLQAFMTELGFQAFDKNRAELISMAKDFLFDSHQQQKNTVLVIDEAQHLSVAVLEEIRSLAEIGTAEQRALSIILAASPGFLESLDPAHGGQFGQRTPVHFHLRALSHLETEGYIKHRLQVAGDRKCDIFSSETYGIIYGHTGGIPRLINSLCSSSMLCAFADGRNVVSADTVNAAVKELHWVPFDAAEKQTRPIANMGSDSATPDGRVESVNVARAQAGLAKSALAEAKKAEAKRAAAERLATKLGRQVEEVAARNEQLAAELESKEALLKNYQKAIRKMREAGRRADQKRSVISGTAGRVNIEDDQEVLSVLVALDDGYVTRHPIKEGRLSVGSGPDNELQIKCPFTSRHHAQVITSPTESVLGDLDSSNGTYVNARRVKRHALRHGDLITIGKQRFKYLKRQQEANRLSSNSNVYRIGLGKHGQLPA